MCTSSDGSATARYVSRVLERNCWEVPLGKYKLSAKMTGLMASVAETDVVVGSGNGIVNGVLRGNRMDVRMVHPHPSPLLSRERGFNRRAFFSGFPPPYRGTGQAPGGMTGVCGNDGGSAPFTLTPALSHRGRGGLIGVLCFSLGSRLRIRGTGQAARERRRVLRE